MSMTHKLFHDDPGLRSFTATVLDRGDDGRRLVLDGTALMSWEP